MPKNILINIVLMVVLGSTILVLYKYCGSVKGTPPVLPSLSGRINIEEIDQEIEKIPSRPWNFGEYQTLKSSINQAAINGLLSGNEQQQLLYSRLDNAYLTTLIAAGERYISTGEGAGEQLYSEIKRFYNAGKTELQSVYDGFNQLYQLLGERKNVENMLRDSFEKTQKDRLYETIQGYLNLSSLKGKGYPGTVIDGLLQELDDYAVAGLRWTLRDTSLPANCAEYKQYEFYYRRCK